MKPRKSLIRMALGQPVLHLVLGALFALLFTWPLLAFDAPLDTWTFIYCTWAMAIVVLFIASRGADAEEEEVVDD